MKNNLLSFLILFLCILFLLKIKETFNTSKSKKFRNIFTTNIFENKTIFLIANNPNVSEKTKKFLNNYDYKDALIVRFNGYKPIIKDYCNSKTDIMVYRKNTNGFHGYNKNNYNKNIINVFTKDLNKNENEFDKYYNIKETKYLDLQSLYTFSERYSFKKIGYPKKCSSWMCTGFNFLIYLLHLKNIKQIYLIGYTFHNKNDGAHCDEWESIYFNKNIKNKNNNIEIML
jgi:hypothetical protein